MSGEEWDLVEADTAIWMEAEYADHVEVVDVAAWATVEQAVGPRKKMKAIETPYDGNRFRSRLEARWAVFFNSLGIKYLYEPEGFRTSAGPYLPDFFLPDIRGGVYVEVKGGDPSEHDEARFEAFEHDLFVVRDLRNPEKVLRLARNTDLSASGGCGDFYWFYFAGADNGYDNYEFCECKECGTIGIEFDGRSARINCKCGPGWDGKEYNSGSPRLVKAYRDARYARFEHGEKP